MKNLLWINKIHAALGSRTIAFAYITAVGISEAILVVVGTLPGVLCHAFLTLWLLSHYSLNRPAAYSQLLPVLALLSLMRLLSFAIPSTDVPRIYWYAMIGIPLLVAVGFTVRCLGLSLNDIGLGLAFWRQQIVIAASGVPLALVAYSLLKPKPVIAEFSLRNLLVGAVIIVIFTGLTEEIIFRGLLQHVCQKLLGRFSNLYVSILFAAMYMSWLSMSYVLFALLIGLFFSWCVHRTGSTWGVILAHGIMNAFVMLRGA